jgi:hypothetical protein
MKRFPPAPRPLALALAACLALPLIASAQDTPPQLDASMSREERHAALLEQAEAQRQQLEAERAPRGGPTVSLNFHGGSLGEYVESLKAAAEREPTNILVRGDADAILVGPTELRDVSLMTALQLVSGDYQDGEMGFKVTATNVGAQPADNAFLVAVRSFGPVSGVPVPRETCVLSLREMTTPLPGDPPEVVVPAETILMAVETVMVASGGEQAEAEIRYHPESGLLIVAGTPRALEASQRVVESIFSDVQQRRQRAREIQQIQGLSNPDALQEQLADARSQAELAEVQVQRAQHALDAARVWADEMAAQADQGTVTPPELRSIEANVQAAEATLREQQIRLDRALERVQQAEQALARSKAIAAGGGSESEAQALREENAMLRDRLAMMEAQIAELRARLEGRAGGGGGTR